MLNKNILVDSEWLGWLSHNIAKGCNLQELVSILINNDFSRDSIEEAIHLMVQKNPQSANLVYDEIDYLNLAWPLFTRVDYPGSVFQIVNSKLQIYLIPRFLSQEECDLLITLSENKLVPSTVTIPLDDTEFRTSQTANLYPIDAPIVSIIDQKISACLGIEMKYSEPTQLQRYEAGQQFKPHTDFFEPNSEEYNEHAKIGGNRTWTFMVYLNNVTKGGDTVFSAIKQRIIPEVGQAVIWNNRYTNGKVNYDSLHASLPVEEGEKFVITKWFRERANQS